MRLRPGTSVFFFFNDTATTEIYTLSLHDALPISPGPPGTVHRAGRPPRRPGRRVVTGTRSEEHTSELQSRLHLVCRLLLEKKKESNTPPQPVVQDLPRGQWEVMYDTCRRASVRAA